MGHGNRNDDDTLSSSSFESSLTTRDHGAVHRDDGDGSNDSSSQGGNSQRRGGGRGGGAGGRARRGRAQQPGKKYVASAIRNSEFQEKRQGDLAVFFFKESCPFCKEFKPTWNRVARAIEKRWNSDALVLNDDGRTIAKAPDVRRMDMAKFESVKKSIGFPFVPQVALYKRGKPVLFLFRGDADDRSLANVLKQVENYYKRDQLPPPGEYKVGTVYGEWPDRQVDPTSTRSVLSRLTQGQEDSPPLATDLTSDMTGKTSEDKKNDNEPKMPPVKAALEPVASAAEQPITMSQRPTRGSSEQARGQRRRSSPKRPSRESTDKRQRQTVVAQQRQAVVNNRRPVSFQRQQPGFMTGAAVGAPSAVVIKPAAPSAQSAPSASEAKADEIFAHLLGRLLKNKHLLQ